MINQFTYSTKGPRSENQDSLEVMHLNNMVIGCVADGVSGKNGGKVASSKSISFFIEHFDSKTNMEKAMRQTHNYIKELQESNKEFDGMATTFTACTVRENLLSGVHVGDSRLCILRGNGIKQLTIDHTEVSRLVQSGKLTFEDSLNYPRRNMLESAIGISGELQIQTFEFELMPSDRILLTTDGIHNVISKKEFRDLSKRSLTLDQFGKSIVETLSNKKLSDNATFIAFSID